MGKIARKMLTNAGVDAAKAAGDYPDAKVPGLTLRVTGAGFKSWTVRYRNEGGEQRRVTLGRYPAMTLADARTKAQAVVGGIAGGSDPARAKREARATAQARKASTVAQMIEDYFRDAAAGRHRQNSRPKRESTMGMERDYFDRLIKPKFGNLPIDSLDRHAVQKFLDEIGETAPGSARHCRNVIRQAFNYGIRRELTNHNPAQLAALPSAPSRERVLSDVELRKLWGVCINPLSVDHLGVSPSMGLALCFAMVTLQRGGEVVGIHAREIDRAARTWTLPGERTKNHRTHVVPLSPLALELLGQAFSLVGGVDHDGDWKGHPFPGKGKAHVLRHSFSHAMDKIAKTTGIEDATAHDFRRTGSTNITGERIGIPRFIVSRVLNQISDTGGAAAVTGVYDRNEYLAEKRKALEAWAALLDEIVKGRRRASNVVRLEK